MPTLKIKENGKWIRLPYVIKIIQGERPQSILVEAIEQLKVSYLENKTVGEVEN